MPRKLRDIRADLRRAGFVLIRTRGSHETWRHPTGVRYTLAGGDGADAHRYQEEQLRQKLDRVREAERRDGQ